VSAPDPAKLAAARAALDFVEPGMALGLGTGSTAALMVEALAGRVRDGLHVTGVPTSSRTRAQAEALGIPLATLDEVERLDLTIDGADEIGPGLALIKGGGGALLQEKIVAASSGRMVVIADAAKEVATLGAFPLPVEVVRFGWRTTMARIAEMLARHGLAGRPIARREAAGAPFVTDEGNFILDLALGAIPDPGALDCELNKLAGVVESGLFVGLASVAVIGTADGRARVIEA
jgi:ribose 5-phosphate isomerase A